MVGDALRPDLLLREGATAACTSTRAIRQAQGLVARRGARGAAAAGGRDRRLEPARRVPPRLRGRALDAGDGVCLLACRVAGIGPRGGARNAAGARICSDLFAQTWSSRARRLPLPILP